MALVIEKSEFVINTDEIKIGHLLYAKHVSWKTGMSGFVTTVTEKEIVVQYHPKIGNVTNHFVIQAQEAVAGDWEIRYSADLSEITAYPALKDDGTGDMPETEVCPT